MDIFLIYSGEQRDMSWFDDLRIGGQPFARRWTSDQIFTNEAILAGITQADTQLLGTVPDYLLDLLSFAAGFNTGSKIVSLYYTGAERVCSTTPLISKAQEVLANLPYQSNHPAKRCAGLLSGFMRAWDNTDRERLKQMREEHLTQDGKGETEQLSSIQRAQPSYDITSFMSSMLVPWPSVSGPDVTGEVAALDEIKDGQHWASFF
jgi:hypothetical protein